MLKPVFHSLLYNSPGKTRLLVLGVLALLAGPAWSEDMSAPPEMRAQDIPSIGRGWNLPVRPQSIAGRLEFNTPKLPDYGNGFRLARLFGEQGPALKVSSSMPDTTYNSLRTAGGRHLGALSDNLAEAFVYLQKRW